MEAHGIATWGWGVLQLLKAYNKVKVPSFVAIGVRHLQTPTPPPLRDLYLSSHAKCGYYRPSHLIFLFFFATHTTFDVVEVEPQFILHIVGGVGILFQPFVCWCRGAMFVCSNFRIAQSPCIGLHCPIPLGRVVWQSCNM